jgi:hypothetical protein
MRVLVTGPESSGTRLVASMLVRAGASVEHHTPRPCIGKRAYLTDTYDAVVLVVRNGYATKHSMVKNHHATDGRNEDDLCLAGRMIPEALLDILMSLDNPEKLYLLTYESVVHNDALYALCGDLGLSVDFECDPIGDANAKYFGSGPYFTDHRSLERR